MSPEATAVRRGLFSWSCLALKSDGVRTPRPAAAARPAARRDNRSNHASERAAASAGACDASATEDAWDGDAGAELSLVLADPAVGERSVVINFVLFFCASKKNSYRARASEKEAAGALSNRV